MIGPTAWRFLNEDGELAEIGWQNDRRSKLWRYNQHYFDDLNAASSEDRLSWHKDLIDLWVADNPPASGNGWEPYPTSLRIVNWVKWAHSGNFLSSDAEKSLAVQARWLSKRLEWHLLGNHLFANAKALVHAGLYFTGPEAKRWLDRGLSILAREVPEQILPDGGQFELSPMYHALAVEDMLDLVNITAAHPDSFGSESRAAQLERWREIIPRMLRWLFVTSHPDGRTSFFNDAAFGVAPENAVLFSYAERLGFELPSLEDHGILDLPNSGLCRLASGPALVLADLAPIGPDYLPGHAHADTLSIEMSLYGQRLFVNSGTSVYGIGAERLRQRGTPAHNTVTVIGENSSEVWSGFRVGARARIRNRSVSQEGNTLLASASHDGYRRMVEGLDHRRDLHLTTNSLTIIDKISRLAPAEARYHLHPDVEVEMEDATSGCLILADGQCVMFSAQEGTVRLDRTTWHPEFGVSQDNKCLVISFDTQRADLILRWR
ncbi:heparinase II/III family protein [Shimia gijangensis]|nr:heparinase II/III family protein [Shimia gijangensis]